MAGGSLAALEGRPAAPQPSTAPAVLVPGFTGSKEDFLPTLGPLVGAGRRVLAYDQRGQFESAALSDAPDDPAAYTVPALAADLLAVVGDLDGPVHLVGHSFGGLVVRAAVIERPEIARSVTLLDSGPAALGGHRAMYLELMGPVLAAGGISAVWAALEQLQAADPRTEELPEDAREFLRRRFLSQSAVAVEVNAQALLDEPDRVAELSAAYSGPLLVACGEADDAWSPAEQEAMAARLSAPFQVISDSVHSPAAENPAETAAVLTEFWTAVERAGEAAAQR